MKTIIAIGGGEIGRPGYPVETAEIDKAIIDCAGKTKPKLLFLPTASYDSDEYIELARKHFGKNLCCDFDFLKLINVNHSEKEIEDKIHSSDIVYVGGGDTRFMLKKWKQKGLLVILKEAWENGVVMSGVSAGANCWFRFFSSDSEKFADGGTGLVKLKGSNWINLSFCPHYDVEPERKEHLKQMMKETPGVAIAADNCSAIIIQDNKYRVITSKPKANIYKVFWKNGKFFKEKLTNTEANLPLSKLTNK